MKGTENFKQIIQNHLSEVAENDSLFAKAFAKENKNIDDCITYILNQVKASGCNGFADEEIFNMAIHYYDEDNLKIGKPVQAKVVVNKLPPAPEIPTRKPTEKKAKVVKMEPTNQVSIFDIPGV